MITDPVKGWHELPGGIAAATIDTAVAIAFYPIIPHLIKNGLLQIIPVTQHDVLQHV